MGDYSQHFAPVIDSLMEAFAEPVLYEPDSGPSIELQAIVRTGVELGDQTALSAIVTAKDSDIPEANPRSDIRGHITLRSRRHVIVGCARFNGDGPVDLFVRL